MTIATRTAKCGGTALENHTVHSITETEIARPVVVEALRGRGPEHPPAVVIATFPAGPPGGAPEAQTDTGIARDPERETEATYGDDATEAVVGPGAQLAAVLPQGGVRHDAAPDDTHHRNATTEPTVLDPHGETTILVIHGKAPLFKPHNSNPRSPIVLTFSPLGDDRDLPMIGTGHRSGTNHPLDDRHRPRFEVAHTAHALVAQIAATTDMAAPRIGGRRLLGIPSTHLGE